MLTVTQGSRERFTNISSSVSDGILTMTATLRAEEEDEGRRVCCHTQQWDNSQPRVSLDIREQVRQTFYFGFLSFFVA